MKSIYSSFLLKTPHFIANFLEYSQKNPIFLVFYGVCAFLFRFVILLGFNWLIQTLGFFLIKNTTTFQIDRHNEFVMWVGNTSASLLFLSILYMMILFSLKFINTKGMTYQMQRYIRAFRLGWSAAVFIGIASLCFLCVIGLVGSQSSLDTFENSGEPAYSTIDYILPAGI